MITVAGGIVVLCGEAFEAFEALPGDPEFGFDEELEASVGTVPLEVAGDEPFTTVVAPPVEVVVPELVILVEVATPAVPVPVEGVAAVPGGFAELADEEPPASAVPPPPPPHALKTTLPPSAVRLPRN